MKKPVYSAPNTGQNSPQSKFTVPSQKSGGKGGAHKGGKKK